MKKFYCNGKIVYMHNNHNSLSAKIVLKDLGLASEFDNVCQALDQDQDMLEVSKLGTEELGIASEFDNVCQALDQDQDMLEVSKLGTEEVAFMSTCDEAEESWEDLDKYFEVAAEDPDCYLLANGKSAPFGLTGVELAALKEDDTIYVVDLLFSEGIRKYQKIMLSADAQLVATDRDLVFSDRSKAVQAYNALFGDLYGTV